MEDIADAPWVQAAEKYGGSYVDRFRWGYSSYEDIYEEDDDDEYDD